MTHATYSPEERGRRHRELTQRAIDMALASRWEDAAATNRELLSVFPRDLSALNRLGKALTELGQYADARRAYSDALEIDPTNNIAKKNIERLAALGEEQAPDGRHGSERIDPRLFIEETGKTGFTILIDLAGRDVIAKLAAGDQVYLRAEGTLLYVNNGGGERIGRVEPRLANRLIKFMDGGNKYAAGIAELNDHEIKLIIRETFQHPSQFGRVSFPAQQTGETIRPYIKDSVLRHEADDEDEYGDDGEYVDEGDEEEAEESQESEFEENEFMNQE
jgi:tetratricopeptide (TPR) repeat protein